MDAGNVLLKPRRIRKNPVKKWTVSEEKALIEFLLRNRNFERPTSQTYYRRFIACSRISVEWKLVRSKVRNMRMSFNKAKTWASSINAESMDEETVKNAILKMCSFYQEFEEIFDNKPTATADAMDNFHSILNDDSFQIPDIKLEEVTMTSEDSQVDNETVTSGSRKNIYSQGTFSDFLRFQSQAIELKKQKLDHDFAIRQQEVLLREREIALKEREIDLKERQINSQEKFKILELEMKERLAMEELKYKYK